MRVCTADGFPFVSNFQLNLLARVFCETTNPPIHPWSPWWIHWHASIKRYDLAQNIGWSTKPSICHFGNICTSLTILRLCQILIVFIMARQFCAPPLSRLSWEVVGIVEMLRNCFFCGLYVTDYTSCAQLQIVAHPTIQQYQGWNWSGKSGSGFWLSIKRRTMLSMSAAALSQSAARIKDHRWK